MTGSRAAGLIALAVAAALLAGCGGGGSPAPTPPTSNPPPLSGRYLTGTVVSSSDGQGIDGVVVRLGESALADTTKNGGQFSISVGTDSDELPDHFQVDTTGAGTSFPSSGLITYAGGQTYYPDFVDMPVAILNGDTDDLGTITITEVTDPALPPPVPYPLKNSVILGRVVKESDGIGVADVAVTFGFTPAVTRKTGKNGYFALDLGRDAPVLPLFPSGKWPPTFSIDTTKAGLLSILEVEFNGQVTAQGAIVVPTEVLTSQTTTLGTITVLDDGGGNNPPPPPPP